jgi:hypothetical protein
VSACCGDHLKAAERKELVVVTIYSGLPIQWPTREEWATQQRDAYFDHKNPHPYTASQKLSLYASEEEVAALITAMQELSRSYSPPGPEAAKQALQPKHGESFRQYSRRYSRMSDAKKQRAYMQLEVSGAIAKLQNDLVPYFDAASVDQPLLTEIICRYFAARKAADEKYIAEVKARPIDDAAWAEELERRRMVEASSVIDNTIKSVEMKTCRTFLLRCHRSGSEEMSSTMLSGIIGQWADEYITDVDVIDAARSLGFIVKSAPSNVALIGIAKRDVYAIRAAITKRQMEAFDNALR